MELLDVNPQAHDQSNNVPINKAMRWSIKCSWSSKKQLLHSLQIHIIQKGTKFQIFEARFPNQFIKGLSYAMKSLLGESITTYLPRCTQPFILHINPQEF